ncbi:M48 family metalloprotease [Candidatus Latescibacterota bacterium]
MHRLVSLSLLAGLAALSAVVGLLLFGPTVAVLVLAAIFLLNWLALGRARSLVLWVHRARPLTRWQAPGLYDIAADLAQRARVPLPQLAVYPSQMPNAFAVGTKAHEGVVAVSTGLLDLLGAREVRGVLAHEFAHLKNRDSTLSLASGIFVQVITVASQGFLLLAFALLLSGGLPFQGSGLFPTLVLVASAPSGAAALQAGLLRTRERLADREAALMTGDPRGLASALHRLNEYSRYLTGWLRRFRFIYTSEDEGGVRLLRTHPSTAERVRDLLAMEREAAPGSGPTPGRTRGPVYRRVG